MMAKDTSNTFTHTNAYGVTATNNPTFYDITTTHHITGTTDVSATYYEDITTYSLTTIDTNITSNASTAPPGCVVLKIGQFVPWDNPANTISQEVEQMFDMIVAVVFLNGFFLISAPTNVINMIAFYKQGMKDRINLLLFFQSFADLVFMAINFFLYADRIYLEITKSARRGPLFQIVLNNYLAGMYGFLWASGFMTMLIACDRCFCVVSPFRAQTIIRTRTVAVITFLGFLVTVGGFFVVGTRWSVACTYNPITKIISPEIVPRKFYLDNRHIIDVLDGVVYGFALPGLFVITVTICTAVTVIKLKQMSSWREKTSSASMSSKEVALTRMLVGMSILFVITTMPGVVFRLMILWIPDISLNGRQYNTFVFMVSVTELCAYINCSINFFIFYFMGSKFKETVKTMFGKVGQASANAEQSAMTTQIDTAD